MITSSGCCSGGANRRTGSRRVGRGPWAVGGGVWLRSPQLRVECLLMKSYHQILFHTSKNFKIFFFTGMFRFLAAHLTAATMSRSLFKISEGSVSWYLVSGMSLLYIYIWVKPHPQLIEGQTEATSNKSSEPPRYTASKCGLTAHNRRLRHCHSGEPYN